MATTKVDPVLFDTTGTASASTFLRGDGAWTAAGFTVSSEVTQPEPFDVTGIPSGTKVIIVNFEGISTDGVSGNSGIYMQLGDAGGFETSGYTGGACLHNSTSINEATDKGYLTYDNAAATWYGNITMSLEDSTNNTWVWSGVLFDTTVGTAQTMTVAGHKALSAVLTQLRFDAVDDFSTGTISVTYN